MAGFFVFLLLFPGTWEKDEIVRPFVELPSARHCREFHSDKSEPPLAVIRPDGAVTLEYPRGESKAAGIEEAAAAMAGHDEFRGNFRVAADRSARFGRVRMVFKSAALKFKETGKDAIAAYFIAASSRRDSPPWRELYGFFFYDPPIDQASIVKYRDHPKIFVRMKAGTATYSLELGKIRQKDSKDLSDEPDSYRVVEALGIALHEYRQSSKDKETDECEVLVRVDDEVDVGSAARLLDELTEAGAAWTLDLRGEER
jgi:biopolymer transport protein ExbD